MLSGLLNTGQIISSFYHHFSAMYFLVLFCRLTLLYICISSFAINYYPFKCKISLFILILIYFAHASAHILPQSWNLHKQFLFWLKWLCSDYATIFNGFTSRVNLVKFSSRETDGGIQSSCYKLARVLAHSLCANETL